MSKTWRIKFFARWAVLVLLSWLDYGLLLALASMVGLGAPIHDWLWYMPLIFLFTGIALYLVWYFGNVRRSHWPLFGAFAAALVVLVAGYDGFGQKITLEARRADPIRISFWASYTIAHKPDGVLLDIANAGGRLYLGYGNDLYRAERRQKVLDAIRRLDEFGIEVYLAVPAGDNFLSVPVHDVWIQNARRTAMIVQEEHLSNVRGLIGDVEPPVNFTPDIAGTDRVHFFDAANNFRDLIDELHSTHPELQIGVTAMWGHFVDRLDGDADLQVTMRSMVDPPGGWDFVNLMTYTSYFPADWQPYYLYLAERAMARLYPDGQSSHLIGLVGEGLPWEPLLDFDALLRDARLSRALDVGEIAVFQLNGALDVFGDDFVARLTNAVNGSESSARLEFPFSRPVSLWFYSHRLADALLDVRWLWLGWVAVCGLIARRLSLVNTIAEGESSNAIF